METILKWFRNSKQGDGLTHNEVISRTMLKIAVVSKYMLEQHVGDPDSLPKDGELWRCRIAKECHPGKNSGCFVVEPLEKVEEDDLVKLVPGVYTITIIAGQLIVRPKEEFQGKNWIMPLQHKHTLAAEHNAYCVIVELDPVHPINARVHT